MATAVLDQTCAEAVDLALEAVRNHCGVVGVGEHLSVVPEDTRVATHYFACTHPGYPGWRWAATVVRAARARVATVNEVCLVPGPDALLAPAWVPWWNRLEGGDLTPGVRLPTPDDDPRVEPGFTGGEQARDADPAEWSQLRAVVAELGLGRERVLSAYGLDEAVERWIAGEGGPDNAMTRQAPAPCQTCAYFLRLSGRSGREFGVCANEFSPRDGAVVAADHGCGAHSDVLDERAELVPRPVWDTIGLDEGLYD